MDADKLLVEKTISGDLRAYEVLILRYQKKVQRVIGRMVKDADIVQDLAQDTFLKAYQALHQFRGDAQFYTWLYRIAINTTKKHLYDLRRNPVIIENALKISDEDETFVELVNSTEDTPESLMATKELASALYSSIELLSDDLKQSFMLREIDGLTYDEIAIAMDCPIGTVRSRIFRAREFISGRLKPYLDSAKDRRW